LQYSLNALSSVRREIQMRWLFIALLTTVAAVAAGQTASLPDGEGKAIVTASCGGCHGMDLVTAKAASKEEWAGTIERMKTYGLPLSAQQTTTVVDYLAKSFPPKGATPAPAAPAAGQAAAADTEAKGILNGACASCHGVDLITNKKADRAEWTDVVDRMKTYGMSLTAAQTTLLVDYLAKAHGTTPPPPAAADAGKKLLDDYCAGCHDLDLVTQRKATKGEWQEIVDRMNGRGAGVPEKDIPPMVEYLAKTYGVPQ
jgi:mono/diheme cytochrome c family protein